MSNDIVAVLDALGEDDFYYRPATTKATIDKAAAEIARLRAEREALQKRVAGLEAALRPFADVGEFIAKHHPDPESDQNHETATLVRHFRAAYIALTGGKDE